MAKPPEEPVHLPTSLALAEKWANETARETKRILSNPLPDGTRVPLLLIAHGAGNALVSELGSCIAVSVQAKIPDDVRKKLASLEPEVKQRLLIAFVGELSSNARTGYLLLPQKFSSVDQLEMFSVQQTLKISEDDVSSFNRFYDALQEIVTTALRALSVFGLLTSTQGSSTTAVKPASGALYG